MAAYRGSDKFLLKENIYLSYLDVKLPKFHKEVLYTSRVFVLAVVEQNKLHV